MLRGAHATPGDRDWLSQRIASFAPPLETREPWQVLLGPGILSDDGENTTAWWIKDLACFLRDNAADRQDPLAGLVLNPALRVCLARLLTNPGDPVILALAPSVPASEP
jgi:hypothetical protein